MMINKCAFQNFSVLNTLFAIFNYIHHLSLTIFIKGWLMVKKHPELLRKGATLDLSDLTADPVIMFQRKWIVPLVAVFWALLPTFIPVICWGESALVAFFICVLLRYLLTLHITWMVNRYK